MADKPRLAPALQKSIESAFWHASRRGHEYLTLEHLLYSLRDDSLVIKAIGACGGDQDKIWWELEVYLSEKMESIPWKKAPEPTPTIAFNRVMERAIVHAIASEVSYVDSGAVLASILPETESFASYLLTKYGVERLPLLRFLSHGSGEQPSRVRTKPKRKEEAEEDDDSPSNDPLKTYAVDLIEKARNGHIDPLVGRELELERIMHILCRRRKNNPLLTGEAGVGKTALAEGLALRIHKGEVPEELATNAYYALDLGALLAGTRYRGDFEARVKSVLDALKNKPGSLLFIDEIHTLVGAGAVGGGSLDAGNLLKPALASGNLRCIGASTYQDLKGGFEKDRALSRRFQIIELTEPAEAEAVEILKGLRGAYEKHHGVKFTDDSLEAAVRLSARHLRESFLPDKALDVVDETGATQRLLPIDKRKQEVGVAEIEEVVAKMAKVPTQSVSSDDAMRLANLEADLKDKVFGQDEAVERVVSSIKLSRSGLRGHERPGGSFLFAGPTGVGKTELAKQLAMVLGVPFIRYDMSEYMEKHAVSRLIGAPPGYVGFEDGGLLVDAVRKQPHAVLLLDEIEKAHSDLFAILLQVMDHATLTDPHGRKADFRHVVIILTTNAGSKNVSQRRLGFNDSGVGSSARGAIEKTFSPEFRNRLDAILYFKPLGHAEILRVVDKFANELQALLGEKKVKLNLTTSARNWLAEKGFDPSMGARPMTRVFEEHVKKPLAEEMLFGVLKNGGQAMFTARGGKLALRSKNIK
ncbi:MAG: ATP-dependent Clp protease ATP-binding subunit ClpA [Holophagaceae bacterium]|nr:ATP-dependent Clp protease ATP-binding subunit ClpA [Holophagaceae bacterium]